MRRSRILRAGRRFKNTPSMSTTKEALLQIPQDTGFPFGVPDISVDFSANRWVLNLLPQQTDPDTAWR